MDDHSARDGAMTVLEHVASWSAGRMAGENFPVALRLLPARPRDHLARLYEYARFVDDVGDEAPGDRGLLLNVIDEDLRALPRGGSTLAAVAGLRPLVEDCGVPLAPFLDLIEANRDDQHKLRYKTFDDLLGYCRLSAAPIGNVVLHIAGAATERNVADSDVVCAALQVLEHCQDVGEDARAGRVYLPAEDLRAAGVPDDELTATWTSVRLRRVIALQVDRASDMLTAGRPLVARLSGWSRVAVAGYVAGGLATISALRRADYDVLARAVRPSRPWTAVEAVRLMAHRSGR